MKKNKSGFGRRTRCVSSNDAFFLIDNSGHFVYVNDAACRSLGHSAEEFAQMRPFDIDPNYDDAAYQALFQLTGGQRLAPFESQQRRKDGTVFPIEASVSRVDIGGRSLLFSSCRDITARKAVEQALQKASERTTGILESITDAFFALDVEFRFTYVNSQAEHLLLRTREELLGQHLLDAFPEASGSTFDFQYQRAFTEQIAVSFEEFFPPLDTWFEVRAYPSESGLSIFFQDVNERRQAQEALRISEQALRESNRQARDAQLRLESALSAGGIATWTWDLVTDLMVVDANFARLFSVSDEYAKGGPSAAYFAAIHPEDSHWSPRLWKMLFWIEMFMRSNIVLSCPMGRIGGFRHVGKLSETPKVKPLPCPARSSILPSIWSGCGRTTS
jgi:PAS domain S-box-containing protein